MQGDAWSRQHVDRLTAMRSPACVALQRCVIGGRDRPVDCRIDERWPVRHVRHGVPRIVAAAALDARSTTHDRSRSQLIASQYACRMINTLGF